MSEVEFSAEPLDLRAPPRLVESLLAGPAAGEPQLADDDRAALEAGGAWPEGRLHPGLVAARTTTAESTVDVLLERGERRGRGWVAGLQALLLHPLPDHRMRLVAVPSPLMVDALVRLNDVGPRPRYEPATRIALSSGELAEALATGDPSRADVEPGEPERAFAAIVEGLREHWKVTTRWEPRAGGMPGREVEVLDTDVGYWLVVPDVPTIELWPTTPTQVFRSLGGLWPRGDEVPG